METRGINVIESIEEEKQNRVEELDHLHTKSGGDPPQSYPTAAPRLQKADNSANGDLRSSAIAADSAYLPNHLPKPQISIVDMT